MTTYRQHLTAQGLSKGTVSLRLYQIRRVSQDIGKPLNKISPNDLEEFLANQHWSPQTARSYVSGLKKYWQWLERSTGAVNIAADLDSPRVPRSLPRPAHDSLIMRALRNATPRVQIMIELMAYGGLRRGEVARVQGGDVMDGDWLHVVGKGGHHRLVPLPAHLAKRVSSHDGYLFPGRIDGHLSPRRVTELVSELLPDGVTPHALRHRYATKAYQGSHDILAVRTLLGHANVNTTMIYTQVDPPAARAAGQTAWRLDAG